MSGFSFTFGTRNPKRRREWEDEREKEKFAQPKEIGEGEFTRLMENLMMDKYFAKLYEIAADLARRTKKAEGEIATWAADLEDWQIKMDTFPDLEKLKLRGVDLSEEDQAIFDLQAVGLMKEIDNAKAREEKAVNEKDKLTDRFWAAQEKLKNYVLYEMRKTFVYEKDGKYFKIANGAVTLTQRKTLSLDEMGYMFRTHLMDNNNLRKLHFEGILEVLKKYHGACDMEQEDKHTILEVMTYIRENPKMSRLVLIEELKKICDPTLRDDINQYLERAKKDKEAQMDLENSIDLTQEKLDRFKQNRLECQVQRNTRNKFMPFKDLLDDDIKKINRNMNQNYNQNYNHQGGFRGNFRGGPARGGNRGGFGNQERRSNAPSGQEKN
ncbi:unnamed protein product [Oikopleura dioica]|uniref:Uncharacterized protein n=1 Tax=Oikopleura dioica TaxID=34765 RepID=E4Y0R7_OIKDI|nr:unnamed protein product [Oikopleura dioica]